MDIATSTIPQYYLSNVAKRVEEINKKLIKRKATLFVLEVGEKRVKRVELTPTEKIDVPVVKITITGESFKMPGHVLRGVFYRGLHGEPNSLKAFGEFKFKPEHQNCGSECDCCKKKRERNHIFFIEKTEGEYAGKVLQIGGDCAEIYLGVSPAMAIKTIGLYEEAWSILNAEEGAGWDELISASKGGQNVDLMDYLAAVASSIRQNGWVSGSRASEDSIQSTAHESLERAQKSTDTITEEDIRNAVLSVDYFRHKYPMDQEQDLNEFESNIKQVAHSSRANIRGIGKAAWLVQGYYSHLAQERRAEQTQVSQFKGEVGQKVTIPVTVNRISSYEAMYGITWIISMSDAQNNAYIWKASSHPGDDFNQGSILTIQAKVKEHSEYKEMKQTRLSHVKMLGKHEAMPDGEFMAIPEPVKKPRKKKDDLGM